MSGSSHQELILAKGWLADEEPDWAGWAQLMVEVLCWSTRQPIRHSRVSAKRHSDWSEPFSQPRFLDVLQGLPLGFWNSPPDEDKGGDRYGCIEQERARSGNQPN